MEAEGRVLKIALDLDGVCYDWEKTARYLLRRKLKRERRAIPIELFERSRHWDHISEVVTKEDWKWLWREGVEQGLFRFGHVVEGAPEGVTALREAGHDVFFLTARSNKNVLVVGDTEDWVRLLAPDCDVYFDAEKHIFPGDLFVDDNTEQILALHEAGKKVIAFAQPWNHSAHEDFRQKGIMLAFNWDDVLTFVREMSSAG